MPNTEHHMPQHTHTQRMWLYVNMYVQVVSEPAQVHDRLVCSILRILHRTRYKLRGTVGMVRRKKNEIEAKVALYIAINRSFDVIKVNYTNNI